MNYKISIIMPIYNAQNTLKGAVDSVINQSFGFENMELILVNDHSTDNTQRLIDDYCEKYDNIKSLMTKENSGNAGTPRNMGLDFASADYLMFLDSDDTYERDICKKLYEKIENSKYDSVACRFFEIDDSKNLKHPNPRKKSIYDKDNLLKIHETVIWNKIYKKSIIKKNNIYFKENFINEDSLFLFEYLLNSNSLYYINEFIGYNHIYRISSISQTSYKSTVEFLESYYVLYDLLEKYNAINRMSFKGRVSITLERCLVFKGNKKQIRNVLERLLKFERFIGFNESLDNKILNFVNILLNKNHMVITTYIMLISNKICQLDFLKKIIRKLVY